MLARNQNADMVAFVPDRVLLPSPTASNRRVNALEFIKRYFVMHGSSPSLREIAAAIGTSAQRVSGILGDLEQQGHILRGKGRRSIRLPDRSDEISESDLVLLARRRGLLVIRDGRIAPISPVALTNMELSPFDQACDS